MFISLGDAIQPHQRHPGTFPNNGEEGKTILWYKMTKPFEAWCYHLVVTETKGGEKPPRGMAIYGTGIWGQPLVLLSYQVFILRAATPWIASFRPAVSAARVARVSFRPTSDLLFGQIETP